MQIHVFAQDAATTAEAKKKSAKGAALDTLVQATRSIPKNMPDAGDLSALAGLDIEDLIPSVERCAEAVMSARLTPAAIQTAVIELAISTTWADDTLHFSADRTTLMSLATTLMPPSVDAPGIKQIQSEHKRARKRLTADAKSSGTQATLGAVMLGVAAFSGIGADPLSQTVGTFIGSHFMGLSGAAATNAGLAWLGGGSLAAGGFGMAGGTFLITHGTGIAAKQTVNVATRLAGASAPAFISELAKLHVSLERGGTTHTVVLDGLRRLSQDLVAAHEKALKQEGGSRPNRVAGRLRDAAKHPNKMRGIGREVRRDIAASEASNLGAAHRAVEAEMRHLTSVGWQRTAQAVARRMGVPATAEFLDRR